MSFEEAWLFLSFGGKQNLLVLRFLNFTKKPMIQKFFLKKPKIRGKRCNLVFLEVPNDIRN